MRQETKEVHKKKDSKPKPLDLLAVHGTQQQCGFLKKLQVQTVSNS
jgi:hypothetical protein